MLVSKQKSQPSFQLFAANNKQMCTKTNFLNSFYDYAIKSFHLSPLLPQLPVFAERGHETRPRDHLVTILTSDIGGWRAYTPTSDLLLTPRSADFTFRFRSSVHLLKISGQTTIMIWGGQNQAFWHPATISPFYQTLYSKQSCHWSYIKFIHSDVQKRNIDRNVILCEIKVRPHIEIVVALSVVSRQPTAATGSFP